MSPLTIVTNLAFFFLLILTDGDGLKIVNLAVPSGVPNTTTSAVILDCDYSLELGSEQGLVLKWFYNDNLNPVYQWIPGRKPQDAGLLKNRIDLNHVASDDPNKKFRAIKINNPTTELSGVYTCLVSTFDDEAKESKKMTIYTPAKSLEFVQNEDQEKEEVTLRCSAQGVFPKPEFNITTRERTNQFPVSVEHLFEEDLFDVEASVTFLRKDLTSKTTFDCILKIPDTDYEETKSISIPTAVKTTPFPQNYRTSQRAPQENFVTAPEHYDPEIFFIREEASSSSSLKATIFTILLLNLMALRL